MRNYNGVMLKDIDFRLLKIIEDLVNEPIYFTQFYRDNGIDEVDIFNAYYAENGQIANLMLILPVTKIPEEITELKALKTLSIEGNGKSILPNSLGKLISLKDLSLGGFNLEVIPESIGNLKHLEILHFSSFDKINFPKTMNNLESLRIFGLYESYLTEIPNFILSLESLKQIDLWSCTVKKNEKTIDTLRLLQERGISVKEPQWI